MAQCNLTLDINSSPKFKPGDRVRVKKVWYDFKKIYVGREYTVRKIYTKGYPNSKHYGTAYEIGAFYVFYESELERVDDMKEFTKKDLKSGDVILAKNGVVGIAILGGEFDVIKYPHGVCKLEWFDDDLIYGSNDEYSIKSIRRPSSYDEVSFMAFDFKEGKIVYERKDVEEMTLEEVCKALGKEIKIVKK